MAKTLNALIYPHTPNVIAERRMIDVATIPPNKASWWRPVVVVGDDAFDPLTHKKTGPVTTIEATQVVDTYSILALEPQEISAAKTAAVNAVNGDRKVVLNSLLSLVNEDRAVKAKINAIIDATGIATAKFPAGQTTQINMAQLKTALEALL